MNHINSRKFQNLCTICIICYKIPPNCKSCDWTKKCFRRFLNLLVLPEGILLSEGMLLNIFTPE